MSGNDDRHIVSLRQGRAFCMFLLHPAVWKTDVMVGTRSVSQNSGMKAGLWGVTIPSLIWESQNRYLRKTGLPSCLGHFISAVYTEPRDMQALT